MKAKHLYLVLCLLGTVLPYSQFIRFLRDHGLDLRLFLQQLFSNPVGGFFGWDVIVSTLVLWAFAFFERRRDDDAPRSRSRRFRACRAIRGRIALKSEGAALT